MKRALVGLVAVATLAFAGAAGAATVQVDGTQHFVAFASDAIVSEMRGALVGEWLTPYATFASKEQSKTAQCSGTESFSGFLDRNGNTLQDAGEPKGTLEFVFGYSSSASGNGRCHHTIEGGEGGFAGAAGQLTFKDRLGACGEVLTTYSGHIKL
jgi:hypothetical protein